MPDPYIIQLQTNQPVQLSLVVGTGFDFPLVNPAFENPDSYVIKCDVRDTEGDLIFSLSSDDDEITSRDFTDPDETGIALLFPASKTALLSPGQTYEFDILAIDDQDLPWPYLPISEILAVKRITNP